LQTVPFAGTQKWDHNKKVRVTSVTFPYFPLTKENFMKFLVKILPILVIVAATGCASNSQVDEVRAIAEEAQRSAAAANTAAANAQRSAAAANKAAVSAQSTANAAKTSANAAQTSANEANEKIDRAFKKAMQK